MIFLFGVSQIILTAFLGEQIISLKILKYQMFFDFFLQKKVIFSTFFIIDLLMLIMIFFFGVSQAILNAFHGEQVTFLKILKNLILIFNFFFKKKFFLGTFFIITLLQVIIYFLFGVSQVILNAFHGKQDDSLEVLKNLILIFTFFSKIRIFGHIFDYRIN